MPLKKILCKQLNSYATYQQTWPLQRTDNGKPQDILFVTQYVGDMWDI